MPDRGLPYMCRLAVLILSAGFSLVGPRSALAQVGCGDTVFEKVTLEADLDCTGDGLIVGADKVVIDLDGFTIEGDGGAGDIGIENIGFDSVTIKDGTIAGFSDCVSIGGNAQKTKLTDLHLFGCLGDGVDLNDSDLGKLKGVVANGNTQNGITLGAGATGNKIEKSASLGNTLAGVAVNGTDNTLKKVDTAVNTDGIQLNGPDNTADGCTARQNVDHGFEITDNGNHIKKCTSEGNRDEGFRVLAAAGTVIEKSFAIGNGQHGIFVIGDADDVDLKKNEAHGNELEGIHVESDSDDTLIDGNDVFGNHTDGIRTDNASSVVKKNEGRLNGQRAIAAPNGAIDSGGNKASANADSPQCENVVCKE